MLDSLRVEDIEKTNGLEMDEREIAQRKRTRNQRLARSRARGVGHFFASPYAAVVCMLVALGSIVGFWRGVPQWALLALGVGAVLIIVTAGFFYRAKNR